MIKNLMKKRFACKKFIKGKKIPKKQIKEILEVARLAPSSMGIQAWKMILIHDDKLKERIADACFFQNQVITCSHLVVFCVNNDLLGSEGVISRIMETYSEINKQSLPSLKPWKKHIVESVRAKTPEAKAAWLGHQVYLPLMAAIIAATDMEINSCPLEGFDPEALAKRLKLNSKLTPVVMLALGYADMKPTKRVRFSLDDLVIEMES